MVWRLRTTNSSTGELYSSMEKDLLKIIGVVSLSFSLFLRNCFKASSKAAQLSRLPSREKPTSDTSTSNRQKSTERTSHLTSRIIIRHRYLTKAARCTSFLELSGSRPCIALRSMQNSATSSQESTKARRQTEKK